MTALPAGTRPFADSEPGVRSSARRWRAGIAALALAFAVAACSEGDGPGATPPGSADAGGPAGRPNVLLVVLDDVGTDGVRSYGDHPDAPPTPNIDALARDGVRFRLAWANPSCTPSRISLLTGELPRTSGLGSLPHVTGGLPRGARTIASELRTHGYRTFFVGKWHVAPPGPFEGHPASVGFDHFSGSRGNIARMGGAGYFDWAKYVGDERHDHWPRYATTDVVDDTLVQLRGSQPWFGILSFHAAHFPLHRPPDALHTRTLPTDIHSDPLAYFRAMIEAMDTELGRVLAALPENTLVMVMGDNGSPADVLTPPFDGRRGKRTPYRGGIRVPLIVAGPGVVPGEKKGPVHLVDVFATLLDWLDLPGEPPVDSVSFAAALRGGESEREWMISEQFGKEGAMARAVLRGCLKLVEQPEGIFGLFDLCRDPFERSDLLVDGTPPPTHATDLDELRRILDGTGA